MPIELCNCISDHGIEVSTFQQPHPSVISYHISTSLFTHCPDFWYYRISLIAFESYTWNPVFVLVVQSCLTLCNLINFSLSGSCVHGIFQARILKWVAIFYSRTWNHTGCPCLITAIWYFAVPPTFCIYVKFVSFHSSLCEFNS